MTIDSSIKEDVGSVYFFRNGDRGLVRSAPRTKVVFPVKGSTFHEGFVKVTERFDKERVAFVKGYNVSTEPLPLTEASVVDLVLAFPDISDLLLFSVLGHPVYSAYSSIWHNFVVIGGEIVPLSVSEFEHAKYLATAFERPDDSFIQLLKVTSRNLFGRYSWYWQGKKFSPEFLADLCQSHPHWSPEFKLILPDLLLTPASPMRRSLSFFDPRQYPEDKQLLFVNYYNSFFPSFSREEKLSLCNYVKQRNKQLLPFWKSELTRLRSRGADIKSITETIAQFKEMGCWE